MSDKTGDLPEPPAADPDAESSGLASMDDELRRRREQTWEMLVIQDRDYGDVVATLAAEYDVSESAIKMDISRMDEWLPKLNTMSTKSGASRLRELRKNRQRRRELLREIREDEDADRKEELRVLNQLDQAISLDVQLSQSLGETDREPQEHVTHHKQEVEHELSDQQKEHLSELKDWARSETTEREDDVIEVENLEDEGD